MVLKETSTSSTKQKLLLREYVRQLASCVQAQEQTNVLDGQDEPKSAGVTTTIGMQVTTVTELSSAQFVPFLDSRRRTGMNGPG